MTGAADSVTPAHRTIGWIGAGMMGSSMCGHLLTAGCRVTIHSRTRSKTQSLQQCPLSRGIGRIPLTGQHHNADHDEITASGLQPSHVGTSQSS
jgi:predicted dinucleotide-binding enzyme